MNKNNTSSASDVARLITETMCGGMAPPSPTGRKKDDEKINFKREVSAPD